MSVYLVDNGIFCPVPEMWLLPYHDLCILRICNNGNYRVYIQVLIYHPLG